MINSSETFLTGMQFKDIIGLKETKEQLLALVKQNRLSHALLFVGKEGTGALPLSIALAQYLVCNSTTPGQSKKDGTAGALFEAGLSNYDLQLPTTSDSCGTCPPCQKANQLIHPDIHFSYPVIPRKSGDKPLSTDYVQEWREFVKLYPYGNDYDWLQFIGAENKQGNITAEECNDIIRKLNLKSFESGYKILIMWMPEYLGKEGNKLLKLIEEPPANTLFILVATDENLVLPTIVSRTQLINIPSLDTADIENALIQRANLSPEQSRQIASVSEGSYREALQLIQHADEDWQSLLREWLNAILRTGPIAQVKWVEEIARLGREKQKQFLRYFNHLLEQSIRIRVFESNSNNAGLQLPETDDQTSSDPHNEKDFAIRLNKITTLSQQSAIIEEIDKATYYIERNANAKMLFQALTFKLYHIITEQTVPAV